MVLRTFPAPLLFITGEQAVNSCENIRASIENFDWSALHPDLRVTISMGIFDDTEAGSVTRMVALADCNLYKAKAAGRNQVVYGPVDSESMKSCQGLSDGTPSDEE